MRNLQGSALGPKQVLARVISNTLAIPGVCLIWLEAPEIASVAKPGQFVMAKCSDDNLLRRPFSVHQVNDGKASLAILFSVVGKGTQWLSRCNAGDKIDLLGPLGNGFSIALSTGNLLLVAGGIGIAPLLFLAQTALEQERLVTLLLGVATEAQLCPIHLIPSSVKCITATDDGSVGKRGMITDLIPEYIDWADQVFACGPGPMYRTMVKMPELKVKPTQISLEVRMGCGFGVCYGCTVKTKTGLKQVCRDGPVFNLDDILWDEFADI
jgi:dihydroorotate dehydrogenase electron transfer subunit